jgi:hypothetical protein
MISMYDSVNLDQIPADAQAVGCYVDGAFRNATEAAQRFPHAHILTIAVSADHDAEALDVESGDATPAEAPAWWFRQKARGIERPCLYASALAMETGVIPALRRGGIDPAGARLWSAHYSGKAHICGPSSCGLVSIEVDGCQWTDQALGRNLDESLLAADFFGTAPAPSPSPSPAPVSDWQEVMMRSLPELAKGATGADVRTIQALSTARGHATAIDGAFGNNTKLAIEGCQRSAGITADGVVGPVTWGYLVTGHA